LSASIVMNGSSSLLLLLLLPFGYPSPYDIIYFISFGNRKYYNNQSEFMEIPLCRWFDFIRSTLLATLLSQTVH
jgi:hypothetical protein